MKFLWMLHDDDVGTKECYFRIIDDLNIGLVLNLWD